MLKDFDLIFEACFIALNFFLLLMRRYTVRSAYTAKSAFAQNIRNNLSISSNFIRQNVTLNLITVLIDISRLHFSKPL